MRFRLESLGNTESRWEQWERAELEALGSQKIYLCSSSGPTGMIRIALQGGDFGGHSTIRIIIHFPVISQQFFATENRIIRNGTEALRLITSLA